VQKVGRNQANGQFSQGVNEHRKKRRFVGSMLSGVVFKEKGVIPVIKRKED